MSLPTPTDTPEPDRPTSPRPTTDQPQHEPLVDAQPTIDLGLKAMALKKYEEAVDLFAQALEALVDKHGELGFECAEVYTLYGKAVLNLAVTKSAVLGGGAPDKKDDKPELAAAPAAGPSSGNAAANHKFHFGGDDPDDDEGDEEEEEEEEEDQESVEDLLETAFQMLDISRTIYEKQTDQTDATKQNLADVHRLLGDVATESEQFENAVDEYSEALSVLAGFLPPYHRQLSELNMLIALALDFVPDAVGRAVEHAEKAKKVLRLKVDQLEKLDNPSEADKRELSQIIELMGDVDMKIEDLKTVPEEAPKTAADLALEALMRGGKDASTGPVVVNNLNSLVRKKKPAATPAPAPAEVSMPAEAVGAIADEVTGGKRGAEEATTGGEGEAAEPVAKKAKVEEAVEARA